MSGLLVRQPGVLSLVQDAGRFGQQRIGLTAGGPLDSEAMSWANLLVSNQPGCSALEISFGGLQLECQLETIIAVAGGDLPLRINGREVPYWRSVRVRAGDIIEFGFAKQFCRSYLAVRGGFLLQPQFGSTSTVVREGTGGFNGDKLTGGELLPCAADRGTDCLSLPTHLQPVYSNDIKVRVIPGYQQEHFSRLQQRRFYAGAYRVTDRSDRMGYRLEGPPIDCNLEGILSEGICHGAIQIPADGQPIVLLNDRQTIGGYPKIGSALREDCARLAQLMPGGRVHFSPISQYRAHNALVLGHAQRQRAVSAFIKLEHQG